MNEYAWPATTDVGAMPEIEGASLPGFEVPQVSRARLDLQFGSPAAATVANARMAATNATAAQMGATAADGAFSLKWQPRYRGH